ncbi:hypothetical protein BDF20DRAFT_824052, partial [Mycotypha africana]|uniref:uncharacterized protein n=1 Tax=Mycotypha africana TaxID=64632 RepID=UPI002301CA7A
LDTLYTHTHRYPDHFIVNTRPSNYKDYMTWRFKNRNLSMHTGYADLRYGAFIKKDRAQHFMSLWSTLNSTTVLGIKIGRGRDNKIEVLPSMIADIYFTVWLNQYPYLVSNPLLSANIDSFRHIDTSGLQNSTTDVLEQYAPFTLAGVPPSTIERDVRSSCANDKCLFITSINHMPNIEYEDHPEFIVNKTDNEQQQMPFFSNLSHYEEIFFQQPNAAHLNPKQSNISLTNHIQYHRAVDQDIATCWTSMKNPQAGDYFGFYMAGDIKGRRVIIYTPTNSIKLQAKDVDNLKEMFEVTVQFVLFGSWEECDIVSTKIMSLSQATPSLSLITFDFQCPSRKNFYEPFKSIRVNFKQDLEEPFELCSLGLDNFLV